MRTAEKTAGLCEVKDIYRAALEKWGPDAQILMAMEEMAEPQKELCKNHRGMENASCIAEEIADVEIMLGQMKLLFGVDTLVEQFWENKLRRLKARVEDREISDAPSDPDGYLYREAIS